MSYIDLDIVKNKIISNPSDTFPETDPDLLYVWKCHRSKWISPYDAWFDSDLISKAIDNIKYRIEEEDSRVIRYYESCETEEDLYKLVLSRFTVAKIAPKVTEFSPNELINIINRLYNNGIEVTHIYDPFSGLGGRAEGCRLLGIKYEGYDINPNCINYAKKLYPDTVGSYNIRNVFSNIIHTDGIVITSPPWDDAEVWPMDGYDMPIKDVTWWINNTIRHVVSPMYVFHINKEIDNSNITIPNNMKGINILLQSTTGYFGYKKYLYIVCSDNISIDLNIHDEWYNNGTEENRFYPGLIPDGWTMGRLPNANDMSGRKSYTNGEIDIYRHPGTEPPGFWLGRSDNADRGWFSRDKLVYHNPDTLDWGYYDRDNQPDGWILGSPIGCGNTGMKYYNNGVDEGLYYPDTQPEGWVLGKISESPNSGMICYTNGIDNKYYYPNDPVPDGWYPGMTKDIVDPYNIGMVWYTDGKNECQYHEGNQPEGWYKGRLSSGTVMYNNGFELRRIKVSEIEEYEKLGWTKGQGGYYASNSLGCRRLFKYDKSKENGGLPPFWVWDS